MIYLLYFCQFCVSVINTKRKCLRMCVCDRRPIQGLYGIAKRLEAWGLDFRRQDIFYSLSRSRTRFVPTPYTSPAWDSTTPSALQAWDYNSVYIHCSLGTLQLRIHCSPGNLQLRIHFRPGTLKLSLDCRPGTLQLRLL